MRKNTDDLRNQNINYREKLTGKIHTPVINYCDCSDTLEQIINKINELNDLYNGLNYTIGEFTPTGNYSNIVEFIKYTGSVLLKKIIELQEEFEKYDNTEILELISNLSQEIVELNNIFDSIIGDFEPTDNYNTIPEYINYSINNVNNHIIELANKVENYYSEVQLSLDDLNSRVDILSDKVDDLSLEVSELISKDIITNNKLNDLYKSTNNLQLLINQLFSLIELKDVPNELEDRSINGYLNFLYNKLYIELDELEYKMISEDKKISNRVEEINNFFTNVTNSIYNLIGDFSSEESSEYSSVLDYIRKVKDSLTDYITNVRDELTQNDNLLKNDLLDILELIGEFEPSSEYSTITGWIQYVHNLLQSIIYNLMDELDYTKDNLIKLTGRVDSLEIESSEHDNRITVLENKVSQMESILSHLINKVNNLLGEAEIVHSVEDNVLILPNELTPKEPE